MIQRKSRSGVVLFVVLAVVVMITLSAYAFTELMYIENKAAHLTGRQIQARNIAESGVATIQSFMEQDPLLVEEMGGTYDNPDVFRGILVYPSDVEGMRGRYSILAPALNADGEIEGVRFGLEDESARINLNALLMLEQQTVGAGKQLLMALPGMTDETADCIMDYLDDDDEPRELGAEFDYYNTLDPPYNPKNGPLDTVEELLLVRGVTPELLFGRDSNRNGLVDDHEMVPIENDQAAEEMLQTVPDLGWSSHLTLLSKEKNYADTGQQRIFLNEEDLGTLHSNLTAVFPTEYANYIVLYRQYGPSSSNGNSNSDNARDASAVRIDTNQQAKTTISNLLDLIGGSLQVKQGDDTVTVLSPFEEGPIAMAVYLPSLMDTATINQAPIIPGRININQCPYEILLGIPGMDELIANEIMNQRLPFPDPEEPNSQHETWLLTQGIVTLEQMKALSPFVCTGGDVFRAQVVGYFENGQAFSRQEVILDATEPQPKILLWRDLTELGRGHPLEVLGLELGIDDGVVN